MSIVYILIISFALALDAFSVAVAAGAFFGKVSPRQKFRLAFHFGLFQFFMPVIGWFAGSTVVRFISSYDHWLALVILALIGSKMIKDGFSEDEDEIREDITKGFSLVSLSVATSIDALAVGFSLCLMDNSIFIPSIVIGLVCAGMTLLGIQFGEKLSGRFGKRATIIGGIMLWLIGIHIVLSHLNFL